MVDPPFATPLPVGTTTRNLPEGFPRRRPFLPTVGRERYNYISTKKPKILPKKDLKKQKMNKK